MYKREKRECGTFLGTFNGFKFARSQQTLLIIVCVNAAAQMCAAVWTFVEEVQKVHAKSISKQKPRKDLWEIFRSLVFVALVQLESSSLCW